MAILLSDLLERMPKPPAQVFHLATPQHMLAKFHWELRQFKERLSSAPNDFWGARDISYSAFNTAVTACHCGDWAWGYADTELKHDIARRFEIGLTNNERSNLSKFYKSVSDECRALHICREIANGSKHMGADNADPDISAKVTWQFVTEPDATMECYLTVMDRGEAIRAEVIFQQAFDYWERLFGELGLIEGHLVVPAR